MKNYKIKTHFKKLNVCMDELFTIRSIPLEDRLIEVNFHFMLTSGRTKIAKNYFDMKNGTLQL